MQMCADKGHATVTSGSAKQGMRKVLAFKFGWLGMLVTSTVLMC